MSLEFPGVVEKYYSWFYFELPKQWSIDQAILSTLVIAKHTQESVEKYCPRLSFLLRTMVGSQPLRYLIDTIIWPSCFRFSNLHGISQLNASFRLLRESGGRSIVQCLEGKDFLLMQPSQRNHHHSLVPLQCMQLAKIDYFSVLVMHHHWSLCT